MRGQNLSKPVQVIALESDSESDQDDDEQQSRLDERDSFPPIVHVESSPRYAARRYRAYKKAWGECEACIQSILEDVYASIIHQIEDFLTTLELSHVSRKAAVPTGLIIRANQTLNATLLSSLNGRLVRQPADLSRSAPKGKGRATRQQEPQQPSFILAKLSSRDCPNKKAGIRALIQTVIASATKEEHLTDEQKRVGGRKPSLMAMDDLATLAAWYGTRYGEMSPSTRPRIVLYFEDLESFDSAVLPEIIYMISAHQDRLPCVLLFAIGTSIEAIHSLLPRSTSELLRVRSFQVTEGSNAFHRLMEELFIYRCQILSPSSNIFALLRDTFLSYDRSLDAAISKLQYMYMSHFFSNPLTSVLHACSDGAGSEGSDEETERIKTLLYHLPSFQQHIEANISLPSARRDIENILSRRTSLSKLVKDADEARKQYSSELRLAWTLFDVLQDTWTEGRISHDLMLAEYYSDKLVARCRRMCASLKRSRDDRCLDFLIRAAAAFGDAQDGTLDQIIVPYHRAMRELVQTGVRQAGRQNFVNGNELGGQPRTEGDKAYTRLVASLSENLDAYLSNALRPYTTLPLYELWYNDDYQILRSAFHPSVSHHLRASITNPASRLPKQLLQEHPGLAVEANEVDLCLAHKLLVGAGKLVNLGDWLGAFEMASQEIQEEKPRKAAEETDDFDAEDRRTPSKGRRLKRTRASSPETIVEEEEGGRGKRRRGGPVGQHSLPSGGADSAVAADDDGGDKEIKEARFLSAAAELAYLGFIQPTKRKAEHVARIVF